jgi:FlaG/FlaF family flagellin (archaellin)
VTTVPGSRTRPRPAVGRRAVAPAVGVVLLVALTVALAAVVGVAALGTAGDVPGAPDGSDPVALSLSVDAGADRLALTHRAGAPLDVRELVVRISVAGTSLRHQPPVPFFAARGFRAGPTGPFNVGADPLWSAGETASLRLASTNAPGIDPGDRVVVRVAVDDRPVATLSRRA